MRLDDRIAALRSDDRLAAMAARLGHARAAAVCASCASTRRRLPPRTPAFAILSSLAGFFMPAVRGTLTTARANV